LDAFQAYFLKSVVDKQRDKYYFLNFVKDICGQLITKALRSGCYGSGFKFSARFDAQPLSFYKNKWAAKLSVEDLAKATTQLTCEEADVTKFGLGMILFSTDSKSRNLQGNFDDDLKRGIYHNYIGASCGLMKKLDFKREDQAYLREAKIQKSGDLGAEQLRELYSVNITMVGNNLYKNGGYTYVSPVLINTPKEQLTLLGLHGYYLVTEVSSELTENSFTTSIRALQEGIEFGGTSPPSSTKPEEEKSPSQPEHDKDAADHYVKEMEAQQSLPVTSTPAAGGDPLHPDDPDHAMREIENQQTIPTFMDQERADDDADFERRDKIYEAGGNPYPSMGTRGVLIHRAFRSSRNSEARAQAQGGTATLEGYDSNTGRQDDPELARQAREANEG
jgi:hypothetical protein